jgi:hypothetical protein
MADVNTQQQKNISPAQRNAYFNQLTRQHIQALPSKAWTEGATVSFEIPKARLLSKIWLLIEATNTLVHATETAIDPVANAPFTLVKKIEVNLNNGFSPFVISGVDAYIMNLLGTNGNMVAPMVDTATVTNASRARNIMGKTSSSSSGTANKVRMLLELPLTLNDRDPAGLIMLQAPDVLVNVNVTMGTLLTDLAATTTGFTATLSNAKITPIIETFSIPAPLEARPDLSILKLVQSRTETIAAAGSKVISLPTGNMYRRLVVFVKDSSGGEVDADLSTDFSLKLNTADQPYKIPHRVLAAINATDYGQILPAGVFVFDFSKNGGIPGFGNARDYLDTAQLTQFDLEFTAAAAGSVEYIYETLSVLKR